MRAVMAGQAGAADQAVIKFHRLPRRCGRVASIALGAVDHRQVVGVHASQLAQVTKQPLAIVTGNAGGLGYGLVIHVRWSKLCGVGVAGVAIHFGVERDVSCRVQPHDSSTCSIVAAVAALATDVGMVEHCARPGRGIVAIFAAVVGCRVGKNEMGRAFACELLAASQNDAAIVAGEARCRGVGVVEGFCGLPWATGVAGGVAILTVVIRVQMARCWCILL